MKKHFVDDAENGFSEWGGYMGAKVAKLEEQFAEDAANNPYKQSDLFAGISIFVNGLTNPSADELKRIMMVHGGVYHTYRKSSTTFIIASNLPDVKIRQLTTAKIISPQWITDCLKQKRILDYSRYLYATSTHAKIQFTHAIDKKSAKEPAPLKGDAQETDIESSPTCGITFGLDIINNMLREKTVDFLDEKSVSEADQQTKRSSNINNSDQSGLKVARTAVDPNFLSEFYNKSRLHHIATLGAGFKDYVLKIREQHNNRPFPARSNLVATNENHELCAWRGSKTIMHIDMDCFFVSVGLRKRPNYRGLPVAVTHSKGSNANQIDRSSCADRQKEIELYAKRHNDKFRIKSGITSDSYVGNGDGDQEDTRLPIIDSKTSLSEIASCSYEARKMGVKNGMFVGAALKLCPQLKTIPYDFEEYKDVARMLYDTVMQYTLDIEAVSCDEMYVDLTSLLKQIKMSATEFISYLRNEISTKTGCPCSAGIGQNRLQARMATKKAKPNGQYFLHEDHVEEYFHDVLISDLPGVGYATTDKLKQLNWKTCSDLQQIPLVRLQQVVGKKLGETLSKYCRGIDDKILTYDQMRKSVSAEVNYGIRFTEVDALDTFLRQLCLEVHNRLIEYHTKGKTITLKYMVRAEEAPVETAKFMGHGFCDNISKSITLNAPTCDLDVITQSIMSIKENLNIPPHELRGIGIQVSKLDATNNNNAAPKTNLIRSMFEKVSVKNKSRPSEPSIDAQAEPTKKAVIKHEIRKSTSVPSSKTSSLFQHDHEAEALPRKSTANTAMNLSRTRDSKYSAKLNSDIKSEPTISIQNILLDSNWRRMLTEWLDSTDQPIEYDLRILADSFENLIMQQMLCEVHLRLRFLFRILTPKNCQWHVGYYRILNVIQSNVAQYIGNNMKLHAENTFNCHYCTNKHT